MEALRQRIVITGAQGFLGSRVAYYYASRYEVFALGHADLDITNRELVKNKLIELHPDIIIHCAAISDTGYSQEHPRDSERINLWGAVHVAEACKECGAKFIFMSSDQVYNGNEEQGLLPEDVNLHPVSFYGRHKLGAENEILNVLPDAVGLRLTWMYDLPSSTMKLNRNLLVNLLQAFQHQAMIKVAVREYRGITSVWDVVKRLKDCLNLPGGAYNFGCENDLTSYETFLEAARCLRLPHPEQWIIADNERFIECPRNLSMSLDKIRAYDIDFPSTCEGLKMLLKTEK